MTFRACIYARYSSDMQSAASIEDQIRLCNEKADTEGWVIQNTYTDAAVSGSSLMRPGIQALIQAGMNGEFDILIAEAMDRLSRDQEDIAGLFKRMQFAGVKIITLSEGEISSLHIGLKGTMNALFINDLRDKTRRGLRGRVEKGKSGGGIGYGYTVKKEFNALGEPIKGDREINEEQADIVRRIFREYAIENKSPKAIAAQLNIESIPCPSGSSWGQSTINGNRKRGTGILNNPLYRGELIWNRQKFIKDPNSGKRVSRINPESEWVRHDLPELRIIDEDLWEAVKAKQSELTRIFQQKGNAKRPKYLLSGLLKCGECEGGFAKVNLERYGCSTYKNKGRSVCNNNQTIKSDFLEKTVLDALEAHLMNDELVEVFCAEYTKHMNTLRGEEESEKKRITSEALRLTKEKDNLIQALKNGVPANLVKEELETIANRMEELGDLLKSQDEPPRPLIHPTMARRYHQEVAALKKSLKENSSNEVREHVRALIEKVVITPSDQSKDMRIDLYGDLAGILTIAMEDKAMKQGLHNGKRLKTMTDKNHYFEPSFFTLVAGAGFEPTTFGL